MSKKMRAALIHEYGRSGVLKVEEINRPSPGQGEVLVQVAAASLNPRDWLLMRGIYQAKRFVEPLPVTLGSDFSGTITALGKGVHDFKVGDTVFGMQPLKGRFGAFAEYVCIRADAVALKPLAMSHIDAAAIPCAGMTSYQSLHQITHLKPNETVLINGASGGVGTYAVQIAKAMGAHVVAVCSAKNGPLCQGLGADEIIDYHTTNFEDRISAYDVVYDVIGRSSLKKSTQCLKPGGRYITTIPGLGTAATAAKSWITSRLLPGKHKTAHLVMVKPQPSDLKAMTGMMADGTLRSVIDSTYKLDDIEKAFTHSQSWRACGKIIVKMT